MQYRNHANRFEGNVPIWRENIALHPSRAHGKVAQNGNKDYVVSAFDAPRPQRCQPALPAAETTEGADDELLTVADVPCDGDEAEGDVVVHKRSMSRKALLEEAASIEHRMAHYPHNPLCNVCRTAHMRQRRVARRTDADDDLLSPVTAPRKLLGADHLIVGKSGNDCTRVSTSGNNTCFIVRDQYSGMGLAFPQKGRNQDSNYRYLKFFVGVCRPSS